MFTFKVEEVWFAINISAHAFMRMRGRRVDKYAAYGCIVAMGERLLDIKNREEFCILDKELNITLVCAAHFYEDEIIIDIITVMDNAKIYIKEGTKVYELFGSDEQ